VVITPQHTTLELSNGSTAQSAQSTSTTAGQKQAYLSPVPFVAGSMARTISATVISPIELFRTRLQALPARKWLLLFSFAMIPS
jgi:solute carrier family 25 protein 39/40